MGMIIKNAHMLEINRILLTFKYLKDRLLLRVFNNPVEAGKHILT